MRSDSLPTRWRLASFDLPTLASAAGWDYFQESGCWYRHFDLRRTWKQADTNCIHADEDLLTPSPFLTAPQTENEARFVASLGNIAKPRWTAGVRDTTSGGSGKFINIMTNNTYNLPFMVGQYGGWYENEPNRNFEGQTSPGDPDTCVAQGLNRKKADHSPWKMNDAKCADENRYVCQWCPMTTTTSMAASTTTTVAPTITTTVAASTTTNAPTTFSMGEGWIQATELPKPCYYFDSGYKADYYDAKDTCSKMFKSGGVKSHLATISSEKEARWLVDRFGGLGRPKWVGVEPDRRTKQSNADAGRHWRNIDGTFFSNTLFYPDEPNGNTYTYNIQMGYGNKRKDTHPWKLNDADPYGKVGFMCEWCPPETKTSTTSVAPSTTTTVAPITTTTAAPTTTTTAKVTSTTTVGPTTTTTPTIPPKTPCPENLDGDMEMNVLVAHIKKISDQSSAMENKKTGRILKFQPQCEEYCTGLGWGPSCAPCGLSILKTKAQCLFPGPFFTGELCHRNATSGQVTDLPCCNLESAVAGDYAIGKATTCVRGKQCNCKKFGTVDKKDTQGRVTQKFVASYLYQMPRTWTKNGGCQSTETSTASASVAQATTQATMIVESTETSAVSASAAQATIDEPL